MHCLKHLSFSNQWFLVFQELPKANLANLPPFVEKIQIIHFFLAFRQTTNNAS